MQLMLSCSNRNGGNYPPAGAGTEKVWVNITVGSNSFQILKVLQHATSDGCLSVCTFLKFSLHNFLNDKNMSIVFMEKENGD